MHDSRGKLYKYLKEDILFPTTETEINFYKIQSIL